MEESSLKLPQIYQKHGLEQPAAWSTPRGSLTESASVFLKNGETNINSPYTTIFPGHKLKLGHHVAKSLVDPNSQRQQSQQEQQRVLHNAQSIRDGVYMQAGRTLQGQQGPVTPSQVIVGAPVGLVGGNERFSRVFASQAISASSWGHSLPHSPLMSGVMPAYDRSIVSSSVQNKSLLGSQDLSRYMRHPTDEKSASSPGNSGRQYPPFLSHHVASSKPLPFKKSPVLKSFISSSFNSASTIPHANTKEPTMGQLAGAELRPGGCLHAGVEVPLPLPTSATALSASDGDGGHGNTSVLPSQTLTTYVHRAGERPLLPLMSTSRGKEKHDSPLKSIIQDVQAEINNSNAKLKPIKMKFKNSNAGPLPVLRPHEILSSWIPRPDPPPTPRDSHILPAPASQVRNLSLDLLDVADAQLTVSTDALRACLRTPMYGRRASSPFVCPVPPAGPSLSSVTVHSPRSVLTPSSEITRVKHHSTSEGASLPHSSPFSVVATVPLNSNPLERRSSFESRLPSNVIYDEHEVVRELQSAGRKSTLPEAEITKVKADPIITTLRPLFPSEPAALDITLPSEKLPLESVHSGILSMTSPPHDDDIILTSSQINHDDVGFAMTPQPSEGATLDAMLDEIVQQLPERVQGPAWAASIIRKAQASSVASAAVPTSSKASNDSLVTQTFSSMSIIPSPTHPIQLAEKPPLPPPLPVIGVATHSTSISYCNKIAGPESRLDPRLHPSSAPTRDVVERSSTPTFFRLPGTGSKSSSTWQHYCSTAPSSSAAARSDNEADYHDDADEENDDGWGGDSGDDDYLGSTSGLGDMMHDGEVELLTVSPTGFVRTLSPPKHMISTGGQNSLNDVVIDGVRVLGEKYEVQHIVGEGAYGLVMKCQVIGGGKHVAIKSFKIEDSDPDAEDVKRNSRREVAILRTLQHPNVVGLIDEFYVRDRLFIVMEFVPCNLLELLEAEPGGMNREAVRLIMFQLCSVMSFIHAKNVIYRDIKPENLLVDEQGCLKLCDFGFARYQNGLGEPLTDYVATRWYRSPELLLGPPYQDDSGLVQYMYSAPIDMWAIGCLMGELLDGEPLFPGDSDLDQLYRIQQIIGPLIPEHEEFFKRNPQNTGIVFNFKDPMTLSARYEDKMDEQELDFMTGLLCMDPAKRLTGPQCLKHPYLADLVGTKLEPPLAMSAMARSRSSSDQASISSLLSDTKASHTNVGVTMSILPDTEQIHDSEMIGAEVSLPATYSTVLEHSTQFQNLIEAR